MSGADGGRSACDSFAATRNGRGAVVHASRRPSSRGDRQQLGCGARRRATRRVAAAALAAATRLAPRRRRHARADDQDDLPARPVSRRTVERDRRRSCSTPEVPVQLVLQTTYGVPVTYRDVFEYAGPGRAEAREDGRRVSPAQSAGLPPQVVVRGRAPPAPRRRRPATARRQVAAGCRPPRANVDVPRYGHGMHASQTRRRRAAARRPTRERSRSGAAGTDRRA